MLLPQHYCGDLSVIPCLLRAVVTSACWGADLATPHFQMPVQMTEVRGCRCWMHQRRSMTSIVCWAALMQEGTGSILASMTHMLVRQSHPLTC